MSTTCRWKQATAKRAKVAGLNEADTAYWENWRWATQSTADPAKGKAKASCERKRCAVGLRNGTPTRTARVQSAKTRKTATAAAARKSHGTPKSAAAATMPPARKKSVSVYAMAARAGRPWLVSDASSGAAASIPPV